MLLFKTVDDSLLFFINRWERLWAWKFCIDRWRSSLLVQWILVNIMYKWTSLLLPGALTYNRWYVVWETPTKIITFWGKQTPQSLIDTKRVCRIITISTQLWQDIYVTANNLFRELICIARATHHQTNASQHNSRCSEASDCVTLFFDGRPYTLLSQIFQNPLANPTGKCDYHSTNKRKL